MSTLEYIVLSSSPSDKFLKTYKDERGRTLLHLFARCSNWRIISFLLEIGCDPNAVTPEGLTPVHLLGKNNCDKVLNLLIQYGANIDLKDNAGLTPFDHQNLNGKIGTTYRLLYHLFSKEKIVMPEQEILDEAIRMVRNTSGKARKRSHRVKKRTRKLLPILYCYYRMAVQCKKLEKLAENIC